MSTRICLCIGVLSILGFQPVAHATRNGVDKPVRRTARTLHAVRMTDGKGRTLKTFRTLAFSKPLGGKMHSIIPYATIDDLQHNLRIDARHEALWQAKIARDNAPAVSEKPEPIVGQTWLQSSKVRGLFDNKKLTSLEEPSSEAGPRRLVFQATLKRVSAAKVSFRLEHKKGERGRWKPVEQDPKSRLADVVVWGELDTIENEPKFQKALAAFREEGREHLSADDVPNAIQVKWTAKQVWALPISDEAIVITESPDWKFK